MNITKTELPGNQGWHLVITDEDGTVLVDGQFVNEADVRNLEGSWEFRRPREIVKIILQEHQPGLGMWSVSTRHEGAASEERDTGTIHSWNEAIERARNIQKSSPDAQIYARFYKELPIGSPAWNAWDPDRRDMEDWA